MGGFDAEGRQRVLYGLIRRFGSVFLFFWGGGVI